jgi:hypothetical protein
MDFQWQGDHTQLMLDFVKGLDFLWNTKSERCRKKTACENGLQEIVRWLHFPELAVEEAKLKSKQFVLCKLLR